MKNIMNTIRTLAYLYKNNLRYTLIRKTGAMIDRSQNDTRDYKPCDSSSKKELIINVLPSVSSPSITTVLESLESEECAKTNKNKLLIIDVNERTKYEHADDGTFTDFFSFGIPSSSSETEDLRVFPYSIETLIEEEYKFQKRRGVFKYLNIGDFDF